MQDGRIGINSAAIHFSTNQDKIASKIITTFHVQDHVFMFHVQDMAFQSADNIKSYFAAKLPNAVGLVGCSRLVGGTRQQASLEARWTRAPAGL